jgi:hypothetical protein
MRTTRWLLAAGLLGVLICAVEMVGLAQRGSSSVAGVWRASEVTHTGSNARSIMNPQPNVIIFTQRYYSYDAVTSDAPRPELPAQAATDKQIADAYRHFSGRAGTYDLKGNELTLKRIAANNPNAMRDGQFEVGTFRMEGNNTLWFSEKATENGPITNPTTFRLTRLE